MLEQRNYGGMRHLQSLRSGHTTDSVAALQLTQDVLQRATFLSERDAPGAVADYAAEASGLQRIADAHPEAAARIGVAQHGLTRHSAAIANGEIPDWAGFLPKLIGVPRSTAARKTSPFALDELSSFFATEPYAAPFSVASEWLIVSLRSRHAHAFPDGTAEIDSAIAKHFISRLLQTARYVLHLVHARSKLAYQPWCALFQQPDPSRNPWWYITIEFPVLIRLLADIAAHVEASLDDMLRRLGADRQEIEASFSIPRTAKLSGIVADLSDPHRAGRTVMRLSFSDGSTLIYKPKPLDIEAAFNRFVSTCDVDLGICALHVLARNGYGWVRDAGDPVPGMDALSNPPAIGRAAACFWMLNATDLHFENVRPSTEGVAALDLETLLTAPVVAAAAHQGSPRWRQHSINTTLLFDASIGVKRQAPNIGGFDPAAHFVSPAPEVHFEIVGDHVRMNVVPPGRRVAPAPLARSHAYEVVEQIAQAFRSTAAGSARSRIEMFIARLDDGCPLRLVLRDTFFYARVLERMRQPRFMRDGALMHLDLLALHAGVQRGLPSSASLHAVVDDEIRQLMQGDIPYFSYGAGSLTLRASCTDIEGFFETSAKAHALAKLRGLELSDIDEQCALVHVALGHPPALSGESAAITGTDVFPQQLQALARRIASAAFRPADEPARWLSMFGDVSGEDLRIAVGDRAYFGGSYGILLALQAVEAAFAVHAEFDDVAALLDDQSRLWSRQLSQAIEAHPDGLRQPLGFSGLGGDLFAQSTLLALDPRRWGFLRASLGRCLAGIDELIAADTWLDVIGGVAGLMLGCEQLLRSGVAPECDALAIEAQRLCARHLIGAAQHYEEGLAWRVPMEKEPLLGYAHGWSGIVVALACAARRAQGTGRLAIESCLRDAAAYPQRLLDARGEWCDVRVGLDAPVLLNRSWCNGMPGFLRGMFEVQSSWSEEVRVAIESHLQRLRRDLGSGDAFRFCCGEMGIADFLLDHARGSNAADPERETREQVRSMVVDITSRLGNTQQNLTPELVFPGLFQGQSGIAYCAARLLLPELPSLSGQHFSALRG